MNNFSFMQLNRNCKRETNGMSKYRLAILGDCATQHLAVALKGYAYEMGLAFDMFDADYDQINAQVLDERSELYSFDPQGTLIYMCTERLYESFCNTPFSERRDFADNTFSRIYTYWTRINQHLENVNILQFTFIEEDDNIFGNYSLKTKDSFFYQVKKLNFLLSEGCQGTKNVYLVDLNKIQNHIGKDVFYDARLYYSAKMPISMKALPIVAKNVVDVIFALNGRFKKCVIVDLDNTLWGGVIGDDGMDEIQIGELGMGHAFTNFQMWLKELKNRGIILAVCSKNDEDTAKEPFLKHPEMTLRMEDISMFVANWEDKATILE